MLRTYPPKEDNDCIDLFEVSTAEEIESSYSAYLTDESRFGQGRAEKIFFPTTEAQVCRILKDMSDKHIPVTVSGGRTGICSGAAPLGGVVVNMERMNRILDIIYEPGKKWSIWVESGVRLSELHAQAEAKEFSLSEEKIAPFISDPATYFYPPDPTEETALIGSTVASNASGARSLYYGSTRDFVLSLKVALTNGEILKIERGEHSLSDDGMFYIIDSKGKEMAFAPPAYTTPEGKSTCGFFSRPNMDIIDLFIGSEGTLGIITAVRLTLVKKPALILAGLSFFQEESHAISFVLEAKANLTPLSLEYFDTNSLGLFRSQSKEKAMLELPQKANAAIFWEAPSEEENLECIYENWEKALIRHGSSMEDTWAGMEENDWLRLKGFRHNVPESINRIIAGKKAKTPDIHKVSTDMAVPDHHLVAMMDEYKAALQGSGLRYFIFGHIGDNHLHVNIIPDNETELKKAKGIVTSLAQKAISLGGVVSAEHGIGKLKHNLLMLQYGEEGIREMARVKKALDPNLILGRGNIIPLSILDGIL
ncbi:FAD-binding oxidoreductase [bacterium]|nr:FAD-binding oxidoreductase [bacterium]